MTIQAVKCYFEASGPIAPAAVPFSNVSLLCGLETGVTFDQATNDESSYAHADSYFSTGSGFSSFYGIDPKFGIRCLRRDKENDNNSGLSYADSAQFAFGSGPFCIETWVKFQAYATNTRQWIIDQFDTAGNERAWALRINNGALQLVLSADGVAETIKASAAWSPSLNTWYHIAGDFDGTTYRTYVDGALKGSSTGVVTLHNSTSAVVITRKETSTHIFDGWLDEWRVIKGMTPYGSARGFVAPTTAFPRS